MADNTEIWQWQQPGTTWKGVGIYHVTLTVTSRLPLLGKLVIPDNDPLRARVEPAALGRALLECHRNIPTYYPEIQILQYCLMPDHLHSVWYVRRSMPKGIKTAVRGFWQAAKKVGREVLSVAPNSIRDNERNPGRLISKDKIENDKRNDGQTDGEHNEIGQSTQIFKEMPFIRPMSRRGQLQTMMHYVRMNPQRLATKRLKPGFFRVQEDIDIAGRKYSGVGNAALLHAERFAPVHVRRTMADGAERGDTQPLRDYMNCCVLAARNGTVMVSPFISPHVKAVQEVLLKEEHPFILLADNGFRDYFKPTDALFDACAAGRVLILSPWDYDAGKRHISRADCIALNGMAEEICTLSFL